MDMIHKPKHYCFSKFEPKDVIREWGLNFNLGSAVKYIARAGRKDDIIQDLKKAREFLTFEIDALEIERRTREEMREIIPDHSDSTCRCSQEKSEEIKISEVLSMKASEFRKRFAGSVLTVSKQVFTGEKEDKWVLTQIHDDGGSTLDIPHVPGTINLRFERLKMRSDMSTNEIDLVLRD